MSHESHQKGEQTPTNVKQTVEYWKNPVAVKLTYVLNDSNELSTLDFLIYTSATHQPDPSITQILVFSLDLDPEISRFSNYWAFSVSAKKSAFSMIGFKLEMETPSTALKETKPLPYALAHVATMRALNSVTQYALVQCLYMMLSFMRYLTAGDRILLRRTFRTLFQKKQTWSSVLFLALYYTNESEYQSGGGKPVIYYSSTLPEFISSEGANKLVLKLHSATFRSEDAMTEISEMVHSLSDGIISPGPTDCLSSTMRKRSSETVEMDSSDELPVKKSVTEEDILNDSGAYCNTLEPQMESVDLSITDNHDNIRSIKSLIPKENNLPPPPRMDDWTKIFLSWSHSQRLMALNELIGLCEPNQVRHMMQVIEPQFQRDFISFLPKELALYVLSFLEPKDLLRAAQTCRYWRILAEDNLLWREKCREAGVGYFSAMSRRLNRPKQEIPQSVWKQTFMRQHNVEMNWRNRSIRSPKILKGHDDHVITCLQFSENRIVSGSDDNTLKVWSTTSGKCLKTLLGHTGGVWSSQMSGSVIVSGSTDRTLRVWDIDSGTCTHTLFGHTSTVRCMHLYENKVVSGSRDATLRMWNVETGECLHVLVGHMAAVRCVQYNGKLVVSGAYDYMVRIWDPNTEQCLHQLSGHTNRVYSLQFDGVHVVSGSLDTSIRVWDVETGSCKHTLMGHQSLTSGMELRDNLLVSGNADSTVKIWDISNGQCLLTLSGANKHLSAVTCLQLINKFVITSSDDGTVKLWDIKTGEFVRNLVALTSGGSGGVVWRIRASETKLVCAVGSRNGTEETKLLVLDFDEEVPNPNAVV